MILRIGKTALRIKDEEDIIAFRLESENTNYGTVDNVTTYWLTFKLKNGIDYSVYVGRNKEIAEEIFESVLTILDEPVTSITVREK